MIESISIRNFQNHERLQLWFDRITTLCGPSDRGKSAIVRALRWVCLNKPQGSDYIRFGCEGSEVVLQCDGHSVSRSREANSNLYRLDEREYSAFSNQVPVDIEQLLNLSEDSFQLQHDPAYWLSLSPGQVAKELNHVINLELIDRCQANISSELRKARAVVEVTKNRLETAKKEAEELQWVKEASRSLQAIIAQKKALDDKLIKINKLVGVGLHQRELQNAANAKPEALLGKLNRVLELKNRLSKLQDLNTWIGKSREEVCQATLLRDQANTRLTEQKVGLCPICGTPM